MAKSNLSKNASSARNSGTAAAEDMRTKPAIARSAAHARLSTDDVERAADLGGGYVLSKLADARLRAVNAVKAAKVPKAIYMSRHDNVSAAVLLFDRARPRIDYASAQQLSATAGYASAAAAFHIVGI